MLNNGLSGQSREEGRPVGYDIFAGNTFDGKTLEPFLLRLKERFSIQRIIIPKLSLGKEF